MLRVLLVCALLASCSEPHERATLRVDRKKAADQAPKRSVYRFESGELVVLDVPTTIGGYADSQKCFLWRDQEFKAASLQCPNDSPGDLGHAEPEKNQP